MASPEEIAKELKRRYAEVKEHKREIVKSGVTSIQEYKECVKAQNKISNQIQYFLKTTGKKK